MDWANFLYNENEMPLDKLVDGYSNTSIFRTMSLSSGEFETRDDLQKPGYHDLFEYSGGQFIARKNGLKAYNFSRGGMTAKEYIESYADLTGFWDKEKACQAYVIALGVNDIYNCNMEIGSISDINIDDERNNKPTFAGYYGAIISKYKKISPDAKFFFVTFPNTNSPHLDDKTFGMIRLLNELANTFDNSYVINLYEFGPIYNDEFKKKYFLYGHMNPSGYILTAQLIDSYIDYIIRHNPDDFKNVGFIGTDIVY